MRIHNGDTFDCSFGNCNKGFTTKSDLQKHFRIHSGERPYRCIIDNCGQAFTASHHLKMHSRKHNGEKPFECKEGGCEKAFTSKVALRSHQQIHIKKLSGGDLESQDYSSKNDELDIQDYQMKENIFETQEESDNNMFDNSQEVHHFQSEFTSDTQNAIRVNGTSTIKSVHSVGNEHDVILDINPGENFQQSYDDIPHELLALSLLAGFVQEGSFFTDGHFNANAAHTIQVPDLTPTSANANSQQSLLQNTLLASHASASTNSNQANLLSSSLLTNQSTPQAVYDLVFSNDLNLPRPLNFQLEEATNQGCTSNNNPDADSLNLAGPVDFPLQQATNSDSLNTSNLHMQQGNNINRINFTQSNTSSHVEQVFSNNLNDYQLASQISLQDLRTQDQYNIEGSIESNIGSNVVSNVQIVNENRMENTESKEHFLNTLLDKEIIDLLAEQGINAIGSKVPSNAIAAGKGVDNNAQFDAVQCISSTENGNVFLHDNENCLVFSNGSSPSVSNEEMNPGNSSININKDASHPLHADNAISNQLVGNQLSNARLINDYASLPADSSKNDLLPLIVDGKGRQVVVINSPLVCAPKAQASNSNTDKSSQNEEGTDKNSQPVVINIWPHHVKTSS